MPDVQPTDAPERVLDPTSRTNQVRFGWLLTTSQMEQQIIPLATC